MVEHAVLDAATDGTTSRALVRLRGRGPLPGSLFVKLAPRDRPTRAFVGALGLGRTEVAVYRHAGDELGVRAPMSYHAAAARWGSRFVLLLEALSYGAVVARDTLMARRPERSAA